MKKVLILGSLLLLAGCTITDISRVETKLFNGDLKAMHEGFEELRNTEVEKRTLEKVEAIGFKVSFKHRTPNVERLGGIFALQRIFTPTAYQGALAEIKKEAEAKEKGGAEKIVRKLLKEAQPFDVYLVPFKVITTYTDRYYFSEKETIRQGDDLTILLVFENGILIHTDIKHILIDTKESSSAFAQGVIEILKEYLGPASALYDFANKIKDQIKPKE